MGHCSPSSTTTWTSRTWTHSQCAAKTTRSRRPSAFRGHEGDIVEVAKEDYWKVIEANACDGYGRNEETVNGKAGAENGCS
jgi:hypothetical protein